jgi:hypothetical protein
VSKVHENTITDKLAQRLRENGIDVLTQLGASIGGYTPDIVIKDKDERSYLCEAEWDSSKFDGLIQADNYSKLPESSGGLLILYPDSIKKTWLDTQELEIDKYRFKAFFFRRDEKAVPSKPSTPDELSGWIKDQLRGKERIDINELIATLRELVILLRYEMPVVESNMSVFNNVLGIQLDEKLLNRIAQSASSYLLTNQILFYQILSTHKPKKYKPIDEKKLNNPYELSHYFDQVLEEDYQAIYSVDVVRTLTLKSLYKVATVIRVLRALAIEKFRPEIIGKVFHSLIPIDIRKVVAAYYTKEYAADILATYAITKGNEKIIDLACGSGTLLVAAYHRKMSLEGRKKDKNILHKKFVENEITGLDIMPFSAHLSTINLALQQPLTETNFIRVGIFDSTTAQPGTTILPLRNVVPIAQRQQSILDDYDNPHDRKTVQQGAISLIPDYQHSFKLQNVDAVIMNPPFTRQESLGRIGTDYKKGLLKRFVTRSLSIQGTSSFYTFFIVIANKFLKENGKLAFVLPATILSKESDQAIRSFLLENYKVEGIVIRSDGFNFSENTNFSEILLLCKREKPSKNSSTTYISLKTLDSGSKYHVEHVLKSRSVGEEIDNPNFRAVTFRQSDLNKTNLFIPISLSEPSIMLIWQLIEKSELIMSTKDLGLKLEEGLRSRQGGRYPECGLSANDTEGLTTRDFWIIKDNDLTQENITVKLKITGTELNIPEFSIPKKCTCFGLRNSDNRTSFDVSDVQDRILVDRFEEFDQFATYCDLNASNINSKWKRWVCERSVHLAVIETLHIEAPNTCFFAYYSEQPRAFSSKFWNVKTKSLEESKLLTLWFNSSLNFIQLLINRVPTGWFKIRGYVFQLLKAPEIDRINLATLQKILGVFDKLHDEEFPAMWIQLARNVAREMISPSDWILMKKTYENFENEIGKGFEPRVIIDRLFIDILNPDLKAANFSTFLSELYIKLLKEICLIKQSAIEA